MRQRTFFHTDTPATYMQPLQMDHRIAALVARAREATRRRSFFLAFSTSPVDFINAQVAPASFLLRSQVQAMPEQHCAHRGTRIWW